MKNYFSMALFMLPFVLLAQTPEKFDDYTFLDNISVMDAVYTLNSKINERSFQLELCTGVKCVETQAFSKTIEPDRLISGLVNFIQGNFDNAAVFDSVGLQEKEHIGELLKLVKQKEFEDLEAKKTDLERTLGVIDNGKNQYSGRLIINKEVPYLIKKNKNDKRTLGPGTLKIIDSKVQFFNNKASSIYIKAELIKYEDDNKVGDGEDNKKNGVIISKEKLIFLNNKTSVALRYFNTYGSQEATHNVKKEEIWIDYNDVFDYESAQFFNYSVANDLISLGTKENDSLTRRVLQRRFFDFFTAIVYSDVMGFNGDNSNSLLNAQARLLIPLNLRNYGVFTPMRQFTTTANIALSSSFEDDTRYIAIADDAETFNNFDLLKKNNLYSKIAIEAATIEYKRLFLNISLGYSAEFYRTGFRYTQTMENAEDLVTNRQLLSLGHGPFLNFEIRPQLNFGADLTFSLEDLNYNDTATINGRNFNDDIISNSGHNYVLFKHNLINIEANFYWLTSPEKSKGGVYAKVGTYFHTESNEIFPQIMVGYATNLTSFVNRFKPKSTTENTK